MTWRWKSPAGTSIRKELLDLTRVRKETATMLAGNGRVRKINSQIARRGAQQRKEEDRPAELAEEEREAVQARLKMYNARFFEELSREDRIRLPAILTSLAGHELPVPAASTHEVGTFTAVPFPTAGRICWICTTLAEQRQWDLLSRPYEVMTLMPMTHSAEVGGARSRSSMYQQKSSSVIYHGADMIRSSV